MFYAICLTNSSWLPRRTLIMNGGACQNINKKKKTKTKYFLTYSEKYLFFFVIRTIQGFLYWNVPIRFHYINHQTIFKRDYYWVSNLHLEINILRYWETGVNKIFEHFHFIANTNSLLYKALAPKIPFENIN